MDELKLFIPITKVDAAKRLVYGVATAELPDVSGEVCDYASTKPHYQKWSSEFAKNTDGKSVGNLRAMHGNVAAGKLVDIAFNDDAKKIEICAKVVDDGEWTKVEEGVYTGFSQGGKYVKRWKDGDVTKYTAEPVEVSLVDSPCLKEATFEIVKADGSTEMRKFKDKVFSADELIAFAAEWKDGAPVPPAFARGVFALQKILKAGDPLYAIVKDVTEADKIEPLIAKIAGLADDDDVQRVYVHKRLPGQTFRRKAEMEKALIDHDAAEAARKQAAPVLDALAGIKETLAKQSGGGAVAAEPVKTETAPAGDGGTVEKKDYSDDERKKMASEGTAMKDGSYPIANKADLENAIQAFGRAKNKAATKRHIIKRAKALKATDMLPADWPGSTKKDDSKKTAGDGDLKKAASADYASFLLQLLGMLERAEDAAEQPNYWDGVEVPKELCDKFGSGLSAIADVVAEIVDLVVTSIKEEEANEAVANAALASDLRKLAAPGLSKAGAKHSKADKERIAKAHDLLAELDPDCCPAEGEDDAEKLAKTLDAERAANAKLLNETILPEIGKLAEQLGKIGATVQTIADQPMPMGSTSVRVVEKSHDYAALADAINGAVEGEDGLVRFANAVQQVAQRGNRAAARK